MNKFEKLLTPDTQKELDNSYNVPNSIFEQLSKVESSNNPEAVSSKGAFGSYQLMPETAKNPGFGIQPLDPKNPNDQKRLSREYLGKMYELFGNWDDALGAYNAGPGAITKFIQQGRNTDTLPKETQEYIKKFHTPETSEEINRFSKKNLLKSSLDSPNIQEIFEPGPYNTKVTEDINTSTQGLIKNMWNSLKQGWDSTQSSSAQYDYNKNQDILDRYEKALEENNQEEIQKYQEQLDKAKQGMKDAEEIINTNQSEISKEPISNAYKFKQQLSQAQGSKSPLIDKLIYQDPQGLGSSLPLMLPQMATSWGAGITADLASYGLTAMGTPEPVISKVAGGIALLAAAGSAAYSAYSETKSEVSDAVNQARAALFDKWQKENPGVNVDQLPEDQRNKILRDIRIKSMDGADTQFNEDMLGLTLDNVAENTLMLGSALPGVLGKSFKSLHTVGETLNKITDYNKLTRLGSTLGRLYVGSYIPEKWEEGFEYAVQQRQFDKALDLGMYENKSFMSSFLADSFDTLKSLNYSPVGELRNQEGKYSQDPQFQTSEEAGGRMGILFGGIGAAVNTGSDLITYNRYSKALKKISPFISDEKNENLLNNVYFSAFQKGNIHHLIEGLKTLKNTKDSDGNSLLSEEDFNTKVSDIKKAYDKYDQVNSFIDSKFGALSKEESSTLKKIVFSHSINTERVNKEFIKADNEVNKAFIETKHPLYTKLQSLKTLSEQLLSSLKESIKDNKTVSSLYSLEQKSKILEKNIQDLNESLKDIEVPKEPDAVTPEMFNTLSDYIVSKVNKDYTNSEYNNILHLKDSKDVRAYLKKVIQETEAKKEEVNTQETKTAVQPEEVPGTPSTRVKYVQQVQDLQDTGDITNFKVLKEEKQPDGSTTFTIQTPQGEKKVSTSEGYRVVDYSTKDKELQGLHTPDHFSNLFKFNKYFEDKLMKDMLEATPGSTQEDILSEHPEAFPSKLAEQTLSKVMGLSNYSDYISLIILPNKNPKRVVFEKTFGTGVSVRGVTRTGNHILLQITDPDTTKKNTLFHPYNPEFYEVQTGKDTWMPIDFNAEKFNFQSFKDLFSFEHQEVTEENFKALQQDFLNAKEFNTKVSIWFEKQGKKKAEVPKEFYKVTPIGQFSFNKPTDGKFTNTKLSSIESLKKAPIVFLAGSTVEEISEEKIPGEWEIPGYLFDNSNGYYAYHKHENGVISWIRVLPDTAALTPEEQKEIVQKINIAREALSKIDLTQPKEVYISQANTIVNNLGIFIQPGSTEKGIDIQPKNREVSIKFYPDISAGKLTLKIKGIYKNDSKLTGKKFIDSDVQDIKDFVNRINSVVIKTDTESITPGITSVDIKHGTSFEKNQKNLQSKFYSSVTPEIIKQWSLKFDFSPQDVQKETPVTQDSLVSTTLDKEPVELSREKMKAFIDSAVQAGLTEEDASIQWDQMQKIQEEDPDTSFYTGENFTGKNTTLEQGKKWLEGHLPKGFSIQDINTLAYNIFDKKVITPSLLVNHIIGLQEHGNSFYLYHEAFHGVFQALLTSDQRQIYINNLRRELNLSNEEAKVNAFRKSRTEREKFSYPEARNLFYEEKLADKYADYQVHKDTKSFFTKLFDKILNFIKNFFIHEDIQDNLFRNISEGAFRNSEIINPITKVMYKTLPGLDGSTSNTLVYTVMGKVFDTEKPLTLLEAYSAVLDSYNPGLQENKKYLEQNPSQRDQMNRIYVSLSSNTGKELIFSEVNKVFRNLNYKEQDEDETKGENPQDADNVDSKGKMYDKPTFEYDPHDGVSAQMKRFISTTLYKGIDPVGREVQVSLPWKEVWGSLLPSLAISSTPSEQLVQKLKYLGKYNKKFKALYDRLIKESGFNEKTGESTVPNLINMFKKAFELDQQVYYEVVSKKNSLKTYKKNKLSVGDYTWEQWNSKYSLAVLDKTKTKEGINQLRKDFDSLNKALDTKSTASTTALLKVFNSVGIDIDPLLAELSTGTDYEELQGTFNNIKPITQKDVSLLKTAILDNKNPFIDDESYLGLRMHELAMDSASLNENTILPTFLNPENKTIYAYTWSNEFSTRIRDLKKIDSTQKLNKLKKRKNGYYSYNPLVLEDDALTSISNLEFGIVGGISQREGEGTEDSPEILKAGVSMKNTDYSTMLLTSLGYFNDQVQNSQSGHQTTAEYWVTSVETKNTQLVSRLPVREYFKEGEFTKIADKHLWSLANQEFRKTQGEFGKYKTKDFILFPFLKEVNQSTFEENKENILTKIKEKIKSEISTLDQLLNSEELKTKLDQESIKKYKNFNEYLSNFYLNDLINTVSVLQLTSGDLGNTKDFSTAVKRFARLIASGPSIGTDEHSIQFRTDTIEDSSQLEGAKGMKVDDGQVYSTVQQKIKDLDGLGRLNEVTAGILNRIDKGQDPSMSSIDYINQGIDLVSSKQVTAGSDSSPEENEVYNKMSVFNLTKRLTSYFDLNTDTWKPLRGFEVLHNLREQLERDQISHSVPESAAKLYFNSPVDSKEYQKGVPKLGIIHKVPNKFRRLQQENDTKRKDYIVYSAQKNRILGSELSDENKHLRDEYDQILSKIRDSAFQFAANRVIKEANGNIERGNLEIWLKGVRSILEDTSDDSQMLAFLETRGQDYKYDSNLPHISAKQQDLFFSTFEDSFRNKVPGRGITLVSPFGIKMVYEKTTGKLIDFDTLSQNPEKYNSDDYSERDLKCPKYNPDTNKIEPGEILLPRKFKELANLKVGDELTDEIFKVIGYRIPTQSYHSIGLFKVSGFFPDYYGDSGVVSKESIVYLMGGDFDLDKLYLQMKAWYKNSEGKLVIHGTEEGQEAKFEGFVHGLLNSNSVFAKEVKLRWNADLSYRTLTVKQRFEGLPMSDDPADILLSILGDLTPGRDQKLKEITWGIIEDTLKEFNLPSNSKELKDSKYISPSVLFNELHDKEYQILQSPELKDAFSQPLSTAKTKESMKELHPLDVPKGIGNSITSKISALKNSKQGKNLMAAAVNSNSFGQFAVDHQLELSPGYHISIDGKTYTNFDSTDVRDKMDTNSTMVGGVADNANDPVASYMGWDRATIGPRGILVSLGVPYKTVDYLFAQSSIKEYNTAVNKTYKRIFRSGNRVQVLQSMITSSESILNKLINAVKKSGGIEVEKAELLKSIQRFKDGELNFQDLKTAYHEVSPDLEHQIIHAGVQLNTLRTFRTLSDIFTQGAQHVINIFGLNSNAPRDTESIDKIQESVQVLKDSKVFTNIDKVLSTPVISKNLENANKLGDYSKVFFIKNTKFAKNLLSNITPVLKTGTSTDEITRNLISALEMQVLEKNNSGTLYPWVKELLPGPDSLGELILKLKENPEYKNNEFLRRVRVLQPGVKGNKTPFVTIGTDSITKFSAKYTDTLLEGFRELVQLDIKNDPEGANSKNKGTWVSNRLYKYLGIKDNFQFKNQSFIKFVLPNLFQKAADALRDINKVLKDDAYSEQAFKDLTGVSSTQFKERFIENYFRHYANSRNLRFFKRESLGDPENPVLKYSIEKDKFNQRVFTVLYPERLQEQTLFKEVQNKLVFPKYLLYEGNILKLLNKNDTQAVYEIKKTFGVPGMLPYGLSPTENEKLSSQLSKDSLEKLNKGENKESSATPLFDEQGNIVNLINKAQQVSDKDAEDRKENC